MLNYGIVKWSKKGLKGRVCEFVKKGKTPGKSTQKEILEESNIKEEKGIKYTVILW